MKSKILAATIACLAGTGFVAQADIILGWETWGPNVLSGQAKDVTATQSALGASGFATIPGAASGTENNAVNSTVGANDSGTFGLTLAGASTDVAAFNSGLQAGTTTAQYFEFTVSADVGSTLTLDTFHFDTAMGGGQASRTWALSALSGSITLGAIDNGIYANFNGLTEVDSSLTGLADRTLDSGESAVFRLDFVGNGNGGNGIRFDNAAVAGTISAVPEPSSLALLLIGGAGLFMLRRKFNI